MTAGTPATGSGVSGSLPALARTLDADPRLDAAALDAFLAAQRAAGLVHAGRPLCRVLSPLVVSHAIYRRVEHAAELVLSAMQRVVAHAATDERLSTLLGIDPAERALHAIDPGYPDPLVVARLDMVFREGSDDFTFLELNADSPAGIVDQEVVERTLYELAPVRAALRTCRARWLATSPALLAALLTTWRAWGGAGTPRIAIVDWPDVGTAVEQTLLQRTFTDAGVETIRAAPDALHWDGRRLSADGAPIDLVYRRLIMRELQTRLDAHHPLLDAVRAGAVCLVNPLRSTVANKKASFAILSDPAWAHLFPADERAVLAAHVPWTRVLGRGGDDLALLAMARGERDDLVLKPNEEYGGKGVVLGWTVGADAWDAALAQGVATGAVLQRRVPMRRVRFPTFDAGRIVWRKLGFDLNPFLFGGRVAGAVVRVTDGQVTNVSAGAGVTGLLVIDDGDEAATHV